LELEASARAIHSRTEKVEEANSRATVRGHRRRGQTIQDYALSEDQFEALIADLGNQDFEKPGAAGAGAAGIGGTSAEARRGRGDIGFDQSAEAKGHGAGQDVAAKARG
jgi:hypothetical protein